MPAFMYLHKIQVWCFMCRHILKFYGEQVGKRKKNNMQKEYQELEQYDKIYLDPP